MITDFFTCFFLNWPHCKLIWDVMELFKKIVRKCINISVLIGLEYEYIFLKFRKRLGFKRQGCHIWMNLDV